ncbi:hypothetical protein [Saccharomonospora iraqiensis]|uniref:hypothetical protein n=1 Tax=Saccharomonospora iraqiensis TaxID=52698 RepID=UPI00022DF885|nr:hypothetical protein [Saccharomonospora iraqiensis]
MKNLKAAAAVAALTLLAACSPPDSDADSSGDAPSLPATAAPSTAPEQDDGPETNERGHLVKELGEEAGVYPRGEGPDSPGGVTFAIDKVEVDPACHEFGQAPDEGHTLVLHMRVATGDDRELAQQASGVLNPFNFAEIGDDGITRPAQVGMCTDPARGLPNNFGMNQQYTGVIEIVVPQASGTVALTTPVPNAGGWEWTY